MYDAGRWPRTADGPQRSAAPGRSAASASAARTTSVHVGRHLGSLEAAVALGLLYAAWRPVRAFGLLPLAGARACAFTVTAAADVVTGRAGAVGEAHHVLDVAGLRCCGCWPVRPGRGVTAAEPT